MKSTKCLNDLASLNKLSKGTCLFFICLLCCGQFLIAQKRVDLIRSQFNSQKIYSLEEGGTIDYKFKAFSPYHNKKIVALTDSVLILEGGTRLNLRQLHSLRFHREAHLLGTFKNFFFGLGVGFFPLNTINQAITGHTPIVQASAAAISAGLLGAGLILREIGLKRIRINKRVEFRLLEFNFEHLGEKKSP